MGNDNRFTGSDHPAGNPLPYLVFTPFSPFGSEAVGYLDFKLPGDRVDDGDGAVFHLLEFVKAVPWLYPGTRSERRMKRVLW